jgi:hypothetical protein
MPLILDQYGNPMRRRIGFLLNYAVNEVSDSETDAIGSVTITPEPLDTGEGCEEEPPQ